jgi:hypothetical protein
VGTLAYLVLKSDMNRKLKIIATCASAGFIVFLNYFVFQYKIEITSGYSEAIIGWIQAPIRLMTSFTSVLGSNIISHPDLALLMGGFILLLLFSVIWTNKCRLDFNETSVWYGLMLYGATVMAALTVSRGNPEFAIMMPGLYHYTSTLFVLAGFLPLAYYYFSRTGTRKIQTEQSQNDHDIQLILLTLISCMMILSGAFYLFPGVEVGYGWFSEHSNIANIHMSKVDYNSTTLDGTIFAAMFGEEDSYGVHAFSKDLLEIYIPPSLKYFEDNQLNLYDPSQSLYFGGIWEDVRNIIRVVYIWENKIDMYKK